MSKESKEEIVRECFRAYKVKDRSILERILGHDLAFTSPYDDAIDRDEYFRRCWANSLTIEENVIEKLVVDGDDVFVTYKATASDGKSFRNTEMITVRDGKIREINVYFGASFKNGKFVAQTPPAG